MGNPLLFFLFYVISNQSIVVILCGNKLQKILYLTIEDRTYSRKNIYIQPCYIIVAIVVYLRTLHFRSVAKLIFTYALFLDKFIKLDFYFSVFIHINHQNKY